jgi:site-specific DNA recombinase
MKQVADLYIRVSTDEQADKGYSQRNQDEMLRKFCSINNIDVRKAIFEDHSAKTFNRPRWKELLLDLKKAKQTPDIILFTKWDRFSRNAGDAYQMINMLRKLGVEPQAIEQPLDLSIPENKMMLAFYLAAPEVENDRRALNVFFGMRRARKEGRYMGLAPYGYVNKTDDAGRKYISPFDVEADILKWAFREISKGIYNTEQVYKEAKQKGLKISKGVFWTCIRNPLYCGKIFLPKHKDEESRFVRGLHEPIITEELFYEVQDVLEGRGRKYRLKVVANESLPLRGFLICPKCGKLLTGSASKGKTKYYTYYHCFGGCTHRFRADMVNNILGKELKKFIPRREVTELFRMVILNTYNEKTKIVTQEKKQALSQIKEFEGRLSKARELVLSDQIEPSDYREMKSDYEEKISRLEAKISSISNNVENIEPLLNKGLENLLMLDKIYENGTSEEQRRVISSMYPEKLTFDGFLLRTPRMNEAIQLIYSMDKGLSENKNRTSGNNSSLSCEVGMTRFELAASSSRTKRATGLRYIPKKTTVQK